MNRFAIRSSLIGFMAWLIITGIALPNPMDLIWAKLLLLLAVFVLVPLGISQEMGRIISWAKFIQPFAAIFLAIAIFQQQGIPAAILASPWFVILTMQAIHGIKRIAKHGISNLSELLTSSAFIMIPIGGAWAIADRLGYRPLDFDPVIVLLTAIHFHYAGFALPLLAGDALRRTPSRLAHTGGWLVLAGVPFVAIGITTTQIGLWLWIESLAAITLAIGGLIVAVIQYHNEKEKRGLDSIISCISAVSLFFSMLLAIWYALRLVTPITVLDIPGMRATHGTLNAFGFAFCGLMSRTFRSHQLRLRTAQESTGNSSDAVKELV